MTVTHQTNSLGLQVPVLHRVVYARDLEMPAQYQRSYQDHLISEWLQQNCRHPYYHSPGWMREKFIQFECDQEAMLFSLRWA